jgi:hypothetical protein
VFRAFRILILLFILLVAAVGTWRAKRDATDWLAPLEIAVYPINGDDSRAAGEYLTSVQNDLFAPIEEFMTEEAARYGVHTAWGSAVRMRLAPQVHAHPPAPPRNGSVLSVMWWSLKLRYWAWRNDAYAGPRPQVRIFVQYYDAETNQALPHSLGLEKGMIGVVNAFASRRMAGSNNVVIAHELLHTLGATDKYDPRSALPLHPDGFADPERSPLYPQDKAELMGGRIPLDASRAVIPDGLHQVVVGPRTAGEINWIK